MPIYAVVVRTHFGALALSVAAIHAPLSAQSPQTPSTTVPRVVRPDEGERHALPDGRVHLLKVGPSNGGAGYLFLGTEEMPVGTSTRTHLHEIDEEILIVHRGRLTVTLNDSTYTAEPGTVVYLPPGTWVTAANPGPGPATLMYVFPRGAVERCMQFHAGTLTTAEQEEARRVCHTRFKVSPARP
jgi:mannose-6-phosphate isomerase-like protein (cupin superfamily)